MAGGEPFGFNNAVFLSEREAADRNYALGFYMRENKCFPEKCNLRECMDYYFQVNKLLRWNNVNHILTHRLSLLNKFSVVQWKPLAMRCQLLLLH